MTQCSWKRRDTLRGGNWQECCQFEQDHKGKCSFDSCETVSRKGSS